jgi:glycosyltransferase involved in cell wall biosynthesis
MAGDGADGSGSQQLNWNDLYSMSPSSVSILIPLYNEEEFIIELLSRVLAAPLPEGFEREILIVDDGSKDSSVELVERFIAERLKDRIRLIRHEKNSGKGAAIRTAIQNAEGHFALIQDADLEYNPREYPRLLEPLVRGEADVVYGSRFVIAEERRVLYFWHALANHLLTLLCNIVSDLNLTDMETCYKAFRTAFVKSIPLESDRFGIEPELTVKFARRRARIFEVAISYHGRTYEEGKKIGLKDAFEALWVILKARFSSRLYTEAGREVLDALSYAPKFNRWMTETLAPFVGQRVLEVGAGNGNMSRFLSSRRQRYVASDIDSEQLEMLANNFRHRPALEVMRLDMTNPADFEPLTGQLDTVVAVNVLEHIEDDATALRSFASVLGPGGRLVLLVPQGQSAFGTVDEALGHYRRYAAENLAALVTANGFELEEMLRFNRVSWWGWRFTGQVRKSKTLSRVMLGVFDRMVWLWRKIDAYLPWPATSLIAIARKRE